MERGSVALNGIGINFKTAIASRLSIKYPEYVPVLSSHKKLREASNIITPGSFLTTREQLLEKYANLYPRNHIYDRSLADLLVFARMNYEGINWYYDASIDYGIEDVLSHARELVQRESNIVPTHILLRTFNRKLLSLNINQDDPHNRMRFDLYENIDQYLYKQEIFCRYYNELGIPHKLVDIEDDTDDIDELIIRTYERVKVCIDNSQS